MCADGLYSFKHFKGFHSERRIEFRKRWYRSIVVASFARNKVVVQLFVPVPLPILQVCSQTTHYLYVDYCTCTGTLAPLSNINIEQPYGKEARKLRTCNARAHFHYLCFVTKEYRNERYTHFVDFWFIDVRHFNLKHFITLRTIRTFEHVHKCAFQCNSDQTKAIDNGPQTHCVAMKKWFQLGCLFDDALRCRYDSATEHIPQLIVRKIWNSNIVVT